MLKYTEDMDFYVDIDKPEDGIVVEDTSISDFVDQYKWFADFVNLLSLVDESSKTTIIPIGGFEYEVTPDNGGLMLTRYRLECRDCPYIKECPNWEQDFYREGYPAGCSAQGGFDVADGYDIYHKMVREDYPEWTDTEFKLVNMLYKAVSKGGK